jgi:DNA-binding transcriptional regulator YdaS (Cro superfamily)
MALTFYVRSLFTLLRTLGISQKAVVDALGTSKARVSQWATGTVPLPKIHQAAFLVLVERAIEAALAQAAAQPVPPVSGRSLLTAPPTPAEAYWLQVDDALSTWEVECYEARGHVREGFARSCQQLADCRHLDPMKLGENEWATIAAATRTIRRTRVAVERLRNRPETRPGVWIRPSFETETPTERLRQIAAWVDGEVEPEVDND